MSLPNGINKIIEEYCIYPKKYLKQLQYQIFWLRDSMDRFPWDLSYSWIVVKEIKSKHGPYLGNGYSDNMRNSLLLNQNNRNLKLGIKSNIKTNRSYYPY